MFYETYAYFVNLNIYFINEAAFLKKMLWQLSSFWSNIILQHALFLKLTQQN